MKLEGAQVIAADRMTVWNAINNPDILQRCIAGCEEMTKASPTQFDAVVKQKVGPVSATFKGVVTLSDIVEGQSLRLDGIGKGGVAASAGAAGVAGAVAMAQDARGSVEAGIGSAVQGARDSVDAHAGALHDAAAERMLNPAIGGGVGTLAADDLADVDVSAIGDGMITDGMDAARTAAADMGAGVSDSVSSMTGGPPPGRRAWPVPWPWRRTRAARSRPVSVPPFRVSATASMPIPARCKMRLLTLR